VEAEPHDGIGFLLFRSNFTGPQYIKNSRNQESRPPTSHSLTDPQQHRMHPIRRNLRHGSSTNAAPSRMRAASTPLRPQHPIPYNNRSNQSTPSQTFRHITHPHPPPHRSPPSSSLINQLPGFPRSPAATPAFKNRAAPNTHTPPPLRFITTKTSRTSPSAPIRQQPPPAIRLAGPPILFQVDPTQIAASSPHRPPNSERTLKTPTHHTTSPHNSPPIPSRNHALTPQNHATAAMLHGAPSRSSGSITSLYIHGRPTPTCPA